MKFNKLAPYFISALGKILYPLLKKIDNKKISESKKDIEYFPVFIVGAPRTGSTLVYQFITNCFDVLYTDNLVSRLYKTFYIAFWFSNLIYKNKKHNCFTSEHGRTFHCGLRGPSECSGFWYRWFPKLKHHLELGDIDDESIKEIRNNILAVSTKYKKHIVFKNLNNGQRLQIIKEIHPNSKIIFIKRTPFFTVQSILKARIKSNIDEGEIWSIRPKNYELLENMNEIEMVVNQVYEIEKEINHQLKHFSKDNQITVNYKDFCNHPVNFLSKVKTIIFNNKVKMGDESLNSVKINYKEQITVSSAIEKEINRCIKELEWK